MLAGLKMGHWVSLVLGCALGLVSGLFLTWQVWPVEYYDTDPADLRAEDKEDYVVMIAAAYAQDGDLKLAAVRLEELGLEDPRPMVLYLFQRYSEAGYEEESRSLARLAYDIGVQDVALLSYVQMPTATVEIIVSPTITPTLEPTIAPTPTEPVPEATATPTERPPEATPTPTEPAPEDTPTPTESPSEATPTPTTTSPPHAGEVGFQLVEERDLGCSSDWGGNYILVYVQDEHGRGLAGMEVMVSGPGGEDSFFTGLKPEVDAGFGDFLVTTPGTYTVQVLGGTSHIAEGITFADGCPPENPYHAWRVAFRRVSR
jgi:hypothetical protein